MYVSLERVVFVRVNLCAFFFVVLVFAFLSLSHPLTPGMTSVNPTQSRCLVTVVGDPCAGKTTFIRSLLGLPFEIETPLTECIDVYPWAITLRDGSECQVNIWDCAGQSCHHPVQYAMFQSTSIYVIAVSSQRSMYDQMWFYLRSIAALYRGATVLIVRTGIHPSCVRQGSFLSLGGKIDGVRETDSLSTLRVVEAHNGKLIAVDSRDGTGIAEAREALLDLVDELATRYNGYATMFDGLAKLQTESKDMPFLTTLALRSELGIGEDMLDSIAKNGLIVRTTVDEVCIQPELLFHCLGTVCSARYGKCRYLESSAEGVIRDDRVYDALQKFDGIRQPGVWRAVKRVLYNLELIEEHETTDYIYAPQRIETTSPYNSRLIADVLGVSEASMVRRFHVPVLLPGLLWRLQVRARYMFNNYPKCTRSAIIWRMTDSDAPKIVIADTSDGMLRKEELLVAVRGLDLEDSMTRIQAQIIDLIKTYYPHALLEISVRCNKCDKSELCPESFSYVQAVLVGSKTGRAVIECFRCGHTCLAADLLCGSDAELSV